MRKINPKVLWFWIGMFACAFGHVIASLLNMIKYNF